ncbi:MAG: YggS family pyridoxal phosphate-dependent enzyme [Alteromonadaceae bacterium]|nr:YggS family pyridoxal phosphate-dependent enzyme [Alteromonadaceae bacterium]
MTNHIAAKLDQIQQRIVEAAEAAERDPATIQLLAVSKTKPVSDIVLAYEAGQRHFGENYVQEGVDKVQSLQHLSDLTWHFIGPIQSNKSALISKEFAWCHTIDRQKIARRLNEQRPDGLPPLNVCIQVNIDNEPTKSGVLSDDIAPLADFIQTQPRLLLRGLMAIPKAQPDPIEQAQTLSNLHSLFDQLKQKYPSMDTLSVGMSADLAPAITHGSTMVRVGTDIFGARTPKTK